MIRWLGILAGLLFAFWHLGKALLRRLLAALDAA